MTKQTVLNRIDSQIEDIKYKADGKTRYSRKDVTARLQSIREMVSDIDSIGFLKEICIDKDANDIMNAVYNVTGLSKDDLQSPNRHAEYIQARKIFSVCANQFLGYTAPRIASMLNKDRTTVIYHLKNHDADMFSCKQYRNSYTRVCQLLGSQITD